MVFNIAFFKNGGMNHWLLIVFVWLTSISSPVYGQKSPSSTEDKRVKVLFAKDFLISQEGENSIQKLVGEVDLKQKNIRMYCASAIIQNETLVWVHLTWASGRARRHTREQVVERGRSVSIHGVAYTQWLRQLPPCSQLLPDQHLAQRSSG